LTLIVDINGKGTVSPDLNGKSLIAGHTYTLKAIAGSGYVFSNWTGSVITNNNPLTFTMQESTLLAANFVPSPFASVKGTYDGLFMTTNGIAEETAGMLKGLTVGEKGAYTGELLIGGGNYAINGAFNFSGLASNHVTRATKKGGPLTAAMTLDLQASPPQITGTVFGTNNGTPWTANLAANRAMTNGSADYTMVLAPTQIGLSNLPPGYGYVLIAKHAGVLSLNGALADGTLLSQTVPVVETGNAPIYESLYGNTGLVMGWIDMTTGAPSGTLTWIKKPASSGLFTNGFTNLVLAQGSTWTNLVSHPAINLPAGQLNISGGNLLAPLSFIVGLNNKNDLTNSASTPTNSLLGTINPKTGLLTITFGDGEGAATTIGKGAVLQNTTNAAGFFLDKTNSGSIILDQ